MPAHGIRLPSSYSTMGIGILGQHPYGWAGTPAYRNQDLPANNWFAADSFTYERIDWEKFVAQTKSHTGGGFGLSNPSTLSNPPFLGAGQQVGPYKPGHKGVPSWRQQAGGGGVARILRGYLRRSVVDPDDPGSLARLYFMWNPDILVRDYQAVIDSGGVDPGGVLGIESVDAPAVQPVHISFGFEVFFDRQTECAVMRDHPGVLVDLQTFDTIAAVTGHGTKSGVSTQRQHSVPALGSQEPVPQDLANVDMVGSQDETYDWAFRQNVVIKMVPVTAIFAPNLAFYGMLETASVTFMKFTHRMTPTFMKLGLVLRLMSMGKVTNQVQIGVDTTNLGTLPGSVSSSDPGLTRTTQPAADAANASGGVQAAAWAMQQEGMQYSGDLRAQGGPCFSSGPNVFDCSSLCWRAYFAIGWTKYLGWGDKELCKQGGLRTWEMIDAAVARPDVWRMTRLKNVPSNAEDLARMQPGDMVIRKGDPGHVKMFTGYNETGLSSSAIWNGKHMTFVQAADPEKGVIKSTHSGKSVAEDFQWIMQPRPNKVSGAPPGHGTGPR